MGYCSGQSVPNCRGWNLYNISAPGFAPQLTPQQGFSVWFDATVGNYAQVAADRREWAARVDAGLSTGAGYPVREGAEAPQVLMVDPLVWPHNPSCPWGT